MVNQACLPADTPGMAASGGYSDKQIKQINRAFRARNRGLLVLVPVAVLAIWVPLAVLEASVLNRWVDPGLVVAFFLGSGIATAAALLATLLGMDGARSFRVDREAESWTKGVLRRHLRKEWHVVHDVEIDGGNIDHVLIGPLGAIAVETKYRSDELVLTPKSIDQKDANGRTWLVRRPLAQAHRHARSLRALLLAAGIRTEVQPVLVLWGPRTTGDPTALIGEVLVGLGGEPDSWIGRLGSKPLTDAEQRMARRALKLRKAGEWIMDPPSKPAGVPIGESSPWPEDPAQESVPRPSSLSSVGHR